MKKKLIMLTSLFFIANSTVTFIGCADRSSITSGENTMIHAKLALLPGVDGSSLNTNNTYYDAVALLLTMLNKIFKAPNGIKVELQNATNNSTKLIAGRNQIMINLTADKTSEKLIIDINNVKP